MCGDRLDRLELGRGVGGEVSSETVLRLTQPAQREELRHEAIIALGSIGRVDELRPRTLSGRSRVVGLGETGGGGPSDLATLILANLAIIKDNGLFKACA